MNELCIIAAFISVCASALSILFYINMTKMLRQHAVSTRADTQLLVDQWMRLFNAGKSGFSERPEEIQIN